MTVESDSHCRCSIAAEAMSPICDRRQLICVRAMEEQAADMRAMEEMSGGADVSHACLVTL